MRLSHNCSRWSRSLWTQLPAVEGAFQVFAVVALLSRLHRGSSHVQALLSTLCWAISPRLANTYAQLLKVHSKILAVVAQALYRLQRTLITCPGAPEHIVLFNINTRGKKTFSGLLRRSKRCQLMTSQDKCRYSTLSMTVEHVPCCSRASCLFLCPRLHMR